MVDAKVLLNYFNKPWFYSTSMPIRKKKLIQIASWTSAILISNQWTTGRAPSFWKGGLKWFFFPRSGDRVIPSHTVIANLLGSYQGVLSLIRNKTICGPQSNQCIVAERISEHQVKPLLHLQLQASFFLFVCVWCYCSTDGLMAAPTSLGYLPLHFSARQEFFLRDAQIKFQPSSELTPTAFCPQIRFILAFARASCSQQWVFRWHPDVFRVIP